MLVQGPEPLLEAVWGLLEPLLEAVWGLELPPWALVQGLEPLLEWGLLV